MVGRKRKAQTIARRTVEIPVTVVIETCEIELPPIKSIIETREIELPPVKKLTERKRGGTRGKR